MALRKPVNRFIYAQVEFVRVSHFSTSTFGRILAQRISQVSATVHIRETSDVPAGYICWVHHVGQCSGMLLDMGEYSDIRCVVVEFYGMMPFMDQKFSRLVFVFAGKLFSFTHRLVSSHRGVLRGARIWHHLSNIDQALVQRQTVYCIWELTCLLCTSETFT